jgi:hypothetical protein
LDRYSRLTQGALASLATLGFDKNASGVPKAGKQKLFSWPLLILFAFLLHPLPVHAQAPMPVAGASTDQKRIQLSEHIRVYLVVAGPAPLVADLSSSVLDPESEKDWKIQPAGPTTLTPLYGIPGWEVRSQPFRLDPYVPGNALPVLFAPVRVNGKEVTPTGFEVTVTSSLTDTKPDSARPVTGIEQLPQPVPGEEAPILAWVVGGSLGVVLIWIVVWRLRRNPRPVSAGEWARMAFERLEHSGQRGGALVDGTAAVVRGYVERRFGIPAQRLTSSELLVAVEKAGWPVEVTESLGRLLGFFDRAKFAGDVPDDGGCRDLLAGCREWINRVGTDPRPG